jgi:hypothetical protein
VTPVARLGYPAAMALRRTVPAALVALGIGLTANHGARAQGGEAAATALFDEGRRLMAAHKYADACPKLAESERLAPSGGTLINLADCYEHTGQTASAWVAWKDAAARANAAGKADVEKRALSKAAALEPTLSRLTVSVDAASDVAGLEIKNDGVAVGHAELGVALPVDPGSHLVEATAPKKKPFSTKVDVAAKQTDAKVTVTLEDEPEAATPPPPVTPPPSTTTTEPPPPPATSSGSTQRTLGIVVGVVGLAGLGTGAAFGLIARSKNDEALQPQNCPTAKLCTQNGLDLTSDAKTAAMLSTVSFIAGGVLAAGGIVLVLTAPSGSPRTGLRLTPLLAPSTAGLGLDAAW